MRPVLASLTLLLALTSPASAAAPPVAMRSPDQLDYLFLGSDRPVLIRLHVRIGDNPYGAPWNAFVDKMFAWFDKDNDGFLSPAEVARLPVPEVFTYAAVGVMAAFDQTIPFAAIDTNKDGKVSKQEFRVYFHRNGFPAIRSHLYSNEAAQAEQVNDAILSRLDPKGDGRLTAAKVAGMDAKLRALDTNEDEMLDTRELTDGGSGKDTPPRAVVAANPFRRIDPQNTGGLVRALLAKYDRNKDGKLSRREAGLGGAAFARLDADGDGLLGPTELRAYLASGEPDFVFRLRLGTPPPGILGRLGLVSAPPLEPALALVEGQAAKPAREEDRAVRLGDTRLSLQVHRRSVGGLRREEMRETYLRLYDYKAGGKGHVTRADLTDAGYGLLLAAFIQADKDADGKLTRDELVEWLDLLVTARAFHVTFHWSDLGRSLFDVLDADGDGRLSTRELRTAWKRLGPLAKGGALGQDDLPRAMRLDITLGQPTYSLTPAAKAARPVAPTWFRKMDKNNDGDISPREWLGTDEELEAIDADGDGLISVAEAIAFDAKMKKDKE